MKKPLGFHYWLPRGPKKESHTWEMQTCEQYHKALYLIA